MQHIPDRWNPVKDKLGSVGSIAYTHAHSGLDPEMCSTLTEYLNAPKGKAIWN
jgi:hypothetical protein